MYCARPFILVLVLATGVFAGQATLAKDCKDGDAPQPHHVGNFNFLTSSWVETVDNMRRYVSCVSNLDPNSDLMVTWYIAGPFHSYVPATEEAKTPRMSDDVNPRPIDGCIEYGQSGERTPAQFMGTARDEERNDKDDFCKQGGMAKQASSGDGQLPAKGWADEVRLFFPSDPDNPHDTMLEVVGKIGISTEGASQFKTFFSYSAKQYKGRPKGNIDDVKVVPRFPDQEEFFASAFYAANKDSVPLSADGAVDWTVRGNFGRWEPVPAYYEFRDRKGRLLSAIPMPLFGEARK
ncbi:hypothetical protein [Mesorhizobium sp.]|uniref:hypothetical protein n=1 Tax=Mesorhizobium sp. TaxID=1871066 RepID=UPI0025FC55DE|nr:hypothetical protein [Mesorhizobium sp.]